MFRFLIIILYFLAISFSQTRYIDEVFDEISITEDLVYGNAPDLPFIFLFESNTIDIDLNMDIYEPVGDTETQRPVIIFLHPGSFFSGSNDSGDMVSLASDAARRGYVGVSASYRLGLNIVSTYSGERAVYRGVQDASAVVRYLRQHHEDLNIDPNKIFIWGSSAGSFIGLHLAYSDDSDRPDSTYGGDNDPDLGCIDCEGNDFVHSSKPNGIVSCWGAIGDLNWINQEDNIPAVMFHGTLDFVVPHNSGLPFTINIALPIVYGSNQIYDRLNLFNINSEVYIEEGEGHEYWGSLNGIWVTGPNEYYNQILDKSFNFLYNQLDLSQQGDINQDSEINVLDIVEGVNLILSSTYNNFADVNLDGLVDILDIILIVNIVIGD